MTTITMPKLRSTIHEAPAGHEKRWLDSLIEQAMSCRDTEIPCDPVSVLLTPNLAEAVLARNSHNRKKRDGRVATIATDIEEERFMHTAECIAFDWNGVLINGQHRPQAVLRSGKPIRVMLAFGLGPETQKYIDSQAPRSAGDCLSVLGYANGNELAAISGWLQKWERDNEIPTNSTRKATRGQKIDYVEEQAERIVRALTSVPSKPTVVSRSVLATCYARFIQHTDPAIVDRFVHVLVSGENLQAGDPILIARNWLIADKQKDPKKRDIGHENKQFDLLVQTWNAWRRGETVHRRFTLRGMLQAVEA